MATGEAPIASVSAPAPSAPAAAPAAAAPAPVSAPAATETAPVTTSEAPKAQGPNPGESTFDYLNRVQMEKLNGKPTEEAPAQVEGETAEGDTPQIDGEEETETTEEAPTTEETTEQPAEEEDPLTLDEPDPIPPQRMAAALKDNPEALAALEKAGISKNELFASLRVAAKGQKVLDLFNGDVETATVAAEQAQEFGRISQQFTAQNSVEDTGNLLREFMKFSQVLDDDGKPVMVDRGDGQMVPKVDGTVGRFIDNTTQLGIDFMLDQAEKSGNADLKAACQYMKDEYDKLVSGSAQPKDYSSLDEQTRTRLEEVDRREKESADRQATDSARKEQEFEVNVVKGIDAQLDGQIGKLLENASLSDGQKKWTIDQVKERVTEKLKNSPLFFNKLDVIMRRPGSEKTMKERIAHGINSARPLLGGKKGVVAQVLQELGVGLKQKSDETKERVAAQTQASKSEIRSATQTVKPGAATPADINRMAREELTKEGKDPNKAEFMFSKVFEVKRRLGLA